MSNYNLDLEFTEDDTKPTQLPSVARIYIRNSTENTGTRRRYISPDCLTEGELNHAIDELIQELEAIRKKGRNKFAADDQRRAERVAVRNGVRIECSQLDDSELAELTHFLNDDDLIEDVVIPTIEIRPNRANDSVLRRAPRLFTSSLKLHANTGELQLSPAEPQYAPMITLKRESKSGRNNVLIAMKPSNFITRMKML